MPAAFPFSMHFYSFFVIGKIHPNLSRHYPIWQNVFMAPKIFSKYEFKQSTKFHGITADLIKFSMAPPAEKKKKLSSADHCLITSATIGENQQKSLGSFETAFGGRQTVRLANKMKNRILRKIWICTDVWMDTLPFFGHAQLGLKLALISPRFDVLVDAHFDGKSELKSWKPIEIQKDENVQKPIIFVQNDSGVLKFPLPDRPLPNKFRFRLLSIGYIDYYVIEFLRSNKQIWDKSATNFYLYLFLDLSKNGDNPSWDVFVNQIWPIFASNIHSLAFANGDQLDNLRRLISPTILSDLNLSRIRASNFLPEVLADLDGPTNAICSAGQALSKWLHTPSKDGQLKRLNCFAYNGSAIHECVINYKKAFLSAIISSSSASYTIRFQFVQESTTPIVPFELVNEWTKEKLTLVIEPKEYAGSNQWIKMKRCPIGKTATVQQQQSYTNVYHIKNVDIDLNDDYDKDCIGPLTPPVEEADQSNAEGGPIESGAKQSMKK